MIRIDMSIFVFPMSIFKSYVTGLGLASRCFRSCDGKMKAGTLFWPGAFSRQPANRVPATIFPSFPSTRKK